MGATAYRHKTERFGSVLCPVLANGGSVVKRQYRLRHPSDFQQVRRDGKFYASPFMVLAFLRNQLDHSRFGFVISKRLGKAVRRNRLKRQMREIIRHRIPQIKPGFDIVFIARQPINQLNYTELEQKIEQLLTKMDLWIV